MMVKSGLEILKFEIELVPRPANLPGQFSLSEGDRSISIKNNNF